MPGHPASACSIELPAPTVRPAVALQFPSGMGWTLVSAICPGEARGHASATASAPAVHPFHLVPICRLRNRLGPSTTQRWVADAHKQGRESRVGLLAA